VRRAGQGGGSSDPSEVPDRVLDLAGAATAPATWLLAAAADGGVPLTQTHALARIVVREAAERWPGWWKAELFGPPHREADLAVLEALHDGLRRLRLVRRRGRVLHATARGRVLAGDPAALLEALASDLGGGDPFTEMVAGEVIATLEARGACDHDQLVAPAVRAAHRGGWRDPAGNAPDEREVSWIVSEILCRGEAYGLIERERFAVGLSGSANGISLSAAARLVLGADRSDTGAMTALVFDARLVDVRGVSARLCVGSHEHLSALHDAIQEAFGWDDDHLYSFWLDGKFWGDDATEFVRPGMPDSDSPTAAVPLGELDLAVGAKIAYVFDYGDEWRVMLILGERREGDPGPRVIERRGTAPAQYPSPEDD